MQFGKRSLQGCALKSPAIRIVVPDLDKAGDRKILVVQWCEKPLCSGIH
jgi:hypothetical protein